ncbi:DUF1295-domain-containing protein [Cystobasidium minutum MCA 4210]|uniref:DUF1295-domain-containing protein n=1 Tax=Cystobasidium minutum MCA 4210 TaxID=1397322 RepID=UPI0034CEF03C|eukprot:jgi/Rhomi1/195103/gm1.3317_g
MSGGFSQDHRSSRIPSLKPKTPMVGRSVLLNTVGTSLALHGGLSVGAWTLGLATDSAEAKDWLWPAGFVANAWYQSVGRAVFQYGVPLSSALSSLRWPEKLLLFGVTLWGSRLFYRIASRTLKRGKEDPRYEDLKKETPSFWPKALFTLFLPEVLFQSIISLPFTLPFRTPPVEALSSSWVGSAAVGLFGIGMALEVLADYQLDAFKNDKNEKNKLCRRGVWSLVRHPNYLGDSLVHLSFALLSIPSYGFDAVASAALLAGPLANYAFLRFVGGDKQNEESQLERYEKQDQEKWAEFRKYRSQVNSFWPDLNTLVTNQWTYVASGVGLALAGVERVFRH